MSTRRAQTTGTARVVIAGGGFAALEAVLALRALAEDRIELEMISPSSRFTYRPAATIEATGGRQAVRRDLRAVAADVRASYHEGSVQAVAPQHRQVRICSGQRLSYDALILAVGAQASAAVPGALTFRDQRDVAGFRLLLEEISAGTIRRITFAVPSLDTWPLPVYELALLSALYVTRRGAQAELTVVTPESSPLAMFGTEASRLVADLLAERNIRFIGGSVPHSVSGDGSLALQFDAPVRADRVVAVPQLRGRRIPGIPANWLGFVPTDGDGLVEGLTNVYAAGDMTSFPIKQGGLAAQQADVIAHKIAAGLGAPVMEPHPSLILRARLLHGEGALVLRTELDSLGRPTKATIEHRESRDAPDLKVFGRYLTPYLSIAGRLQPAA